MNYYSGYDSNQALADWQVSLFIIIFRLLFKLVVFAPLIATGYLISRQVLTAQDSHTKWFVFTLLFAGFLYGIITVLKAWMNALRRNGNFFWIPLFVVCVLYTCGLSMYIVFTPLSQLIAGFHKGGSVVATWLITLAYGAYVYRHYNFLKQ